MQRKITLLIIITLIISSTSPSLSFADKGSDSTNIPKETQERLRKEDTYLLRSTRITPSAMRDTVSGEFGTYVEGPEPGEVNIIDTLGDESGYTTCTDKSFSDFETFKYATVKVIEHIPGVNDVWKYGSDIYKALKAIYSDLSTIDGTNKVDVVTKYAYRYFWHDLYVFDYDNTWKWVGESVSKYYYKHYAMFCFLESEGEFRWRTYSYSHRNGYSPEVIAAAPNHKDYTSLSNIAYECWLNDTSFRETY